MVETYKLENNVYIYTCIYVLCSPNLIQICFASMVFYHHMHVHEHNQKKGTMHHTPCDIGGSLLLLLLLEMA